MDVSGPLSRHSWGGIHDAPKNVCVGGYSALWSEKYWATTYCHLHSRTLPMKQNEKVALSHGIENVLTIHFSILPLFTFLSQPSQRYAILGDTVCLHGHFDLNTQTGMRAVWFYGAFIQCTCTCMF